MEDLQQGDVAEVVGGIGYPHVRTQVDGKQDWYSAASGLDCSHSKDMARQEFADEADITKLLGRYGVGPQPQRQVTYGEWDESINLQGAYQAVEDARAAYAKAPEWIQESYPSWGAMLEGLAKGEIQERKATWEENQRRKQALEDRRSAMEKLWEAQEASLKKDTTDKE